MITSPSRQVIDLDIRKFLRAVWNAGGLKPRHSHLNSSRARRLLACGLSLVLILIVGLQAAGAQAQSKRKVPIVSKLTSGGSKLAFSGKVEAVDLKLHVLELNAKESKSLEIFPIKNGISVTSANGERMKLSELKPGYEVIVYYEQKGGKRTVKDIVFLTAGTDEKPKESAPPS